MYRKMLKTSERLLLKLPTKAHIEFIGDFCGVGVFRYELCSTEILTSTIWYKLFVTICKKFLQFLQLKFLPRIGGFVGRAVANSS